jgi:alkyl hydroperoxide reductase subunit AhpC
MTAQIRKPAPDFTAQAVVGEDFKTVKLSDFRGKYVILFFYPLDFTFVCPTEIIAFDERLEDFKKRAAEVLGVSIDSHFSHLAWKKQARQEGGIGDIRYPLVSDISKTIARDYGVLIGDDDPTDPGVALRGLFLIDQKGVLRSMIVNDLPLGRSVDEAVRLVDALQFNEKHGEVCPANWQTGGATIKPDPKGSKAYFSKAAK